MRNIIYPDGSGKVWIADFPYTLEPEEVKELLDAGVVFWRFKDDVMVRAYSAVADAKRKKRAPSSKTRSATRVCVYEVDTPAGVTIQVSNIRQFIRALFGPHSQWLYTKALGGGTIEGYQFRKVGYEHYSSQNGTYNKPLSNQE